jgi:prepilin-type N-terminal cleavage/methylation domain-containing protein
MLNRNQQTGFSLVEMMITLGISLVLLLAIYKVYSSFVQSGFNNLRHTQLHQTMETNLNLMSRELQRATTEVNYTSFDWDTDMILKLTDEEGDVMVITPGNPVSFPIVRAGEIGPILGAGPAYGNGRVQINLYNGSGASAQGTVLTPFQNLPGSGKLDPGEWFVVDSGVKSYGENTRVLNSGNCILFSYDKNKNKEIENDSNINEQYGYKLTTQSSVGKIQQRIGGDFTDCSTGTWVDMTNPNLVNVSQLSFTVSNSDVTGTSGGIISRKKIAISLTGQLVADASYTKTLTKMVEIKNDQYVAS